MRSVLRGISRLPAAVVIGLVWLYQKTISRILAPSCRFHPTCSQYMILAVKKYGVICGVPRGIWRICRCHPWSDGGEDWP